jgi:tRNA threonylcarbamoyladenosine biosynthesis protein TsaE
MVNSDMYMQRDVSSLEQLRDFVREIATSLKGGDVLGLVGGLGAGKTTFTQMLAKELGVEASVKSPTFTLMQEYEITSEVMREKDVCALVHVDAYRIEDPRELEVIGLYDVAGASDTVTVLEWAEKAPKLRELPGYHEFVFVHEGEKRTVKS